MANRLKEMLAAGRPAIGAQLRFGLPAIAELFGLAGFDWVLIDTEHAPQTPIGVQAQLQAVAGTGATAIVRAARTDADLLKLYLDMGAMGILVPFIETPEQALAGAQACRYPPRGTRGWGPHRAAEYGLRAAEYTASINDEVMYIALIETALAVENIERIMAIDGVDACMIGPVDLAISLGTPFDYEAPVFVDAVAKVLEGCLGSGKPPGIPRMGVSDADDRLRQDIESGFRLILAGMDESLLSSGCRDTLSSLADVR